MSISSDSALYVGLVCIAAFLAYHGLSVRERPAPLPPGPRGLPLIGNVFDLPQSQPWMKFSEWGDTYGLPSFLL